MSPAPLNTHEASGDAAVMAGRCITASSSAAAEPSIQVRRGARWSRLMPWHEWNRSRSAWGAQLASAVKPEAARGVLVVLTLARTKPRPHRRAALYAGRTGGYGRRSAAARRFYLQHPPELPADVWRYRSGRPQVRQVRPKLRHHGPFALRSGTVQAEKRFIVSRNSMFRYHWGRS